jgi:hypothetical protein
MNRKKQYKCTTTTVNMLSGSVYKITVNEKTTRADKSQQHTRPSGKINTVPP